MRHSPIPWLLVTLLALLVVVPLVAWGAWVATADLRGRGDAHVRLHSADFRIVAYDHFFEACSAIQGLEGSIDELAVQYREASDARSRSIALTSLTGVKAARHQAIADYNADARKAYTEGQFRDASLPYQIPDSNYPDEGGRTVCGRP